MAETAAELWEKLREEIERELAELSRQKSELAALDERVAQVRLHGDTRLVLDVGGTHFVTSRATLCFDSRSLLARAFGSPESQLRPQADGSFFIDRCPRHFAEMLDYMRSGNAGVLSLSSRSLPELMELRCEAEFYGLSRLCREISAVLDGAINCVQQTSAAATLRASQLSEVQPITPSGAGRNSADSQSFGWLLDCPHVRIDGVKVLETPAQLARVVIADRAFSCGTCRWTIEVLCFAGPASAGVVAVGADRSRTNIGDTADAWGFLSTGRFRTDGTEFDTGIAPWHGAGKVEMSFRLDLDIGILAVQCGSISYSVTVPRGISLLPAVAATPGCSYTLVQP